MLVDASTLINLRNKVVIGESGICKRIVTEEEWERSEKEGDGMASLRRQEWRETPHVTRSTLHLSLTEIQTPGGRRFVVAASQQL